MDKELDRLSTNLMKAQRLVAQHEQAVADAKYGLKNAQALLYSAEDALREWHERHPAASMDA